MEELLALLQQNSLTTLLTSVLILVVAKYITRVDKFISNQSEINQEVRLIAKGQERHEKDLEEIRDDVEELKSNHYPVRYRK